jgi:hypothetical protein
LRVDQVHVPHVDGEFHHLADPADRARRRAGGDLLAVDL